MNSTVQQDIDEITARAKAETATLAPDYPQAWYAYAFSVLSERYRERAAHDAEIVAGEIRENERLRAALKEIADRDDVHGSHRLARAALAKAKTTG